MRLRASQKLVITWRRFYKRYNILVAMCGVCHRMLFSVYICCVYKQKEKEQDNDESMDTLNTLFLYNDVFYHMDGT